MSQVVIENGVDEGEWNGSALSSPARKFISTTFEFY